MFVIEIVIAVLLGLLIVVSSIYLTYFSYNNHQKLKQRVENGDYEIEDNKKGKIFSIVLVIFFGFSLFSFVTNMVYRSSPIINDKYYVSVNSDSMSQAISNNIYLEQNHLTNQIAQYDIAVCEKLGDKEIKKYDVILFSKEDKLIIHRVIEITENNTYITKGDKNEIKDSWEVSRDEVLGIYMHSLKFMSFINYLGYTPGFYIFLGGLTYDLGVILLFEIKKEKLLKQYQKQEE